MKTILNENRLDLAKLFTGVGVEIGVADGYYSSKIMELGKITKLYGVDPYIRHTGYVDYRLDSTFKRLKNNAHKRLSKYPNYEFIEEFSVEASKRFEDKSLDFVYIDGDHSYKAVMEDIKAWLPKLKPRGIMAGDDYIRSHRGKQYYNVVDAVNDYVENNDIDLFIYQEGRNPSNWMIRCE
jgi:hypothetical protein